MLNVHCIRQTKRMGATLVKMRKPLEKFLKLDTTRELKDEEHPKYLTYL